MDLFAHAAQIVRAGDRDRYLSDLLTPEPARRHLLVLHAFNVEVARVRESTNEPGLGELRLQFWHDSIHGTGAGHPVAQALVETIATFNLPMVAFDNLIDARRFDLYNDPMPSLNDLEGYAGDTSSCLVQLAAIILAGGHDSSTSEIAGHAGVAYALTGLLRSLPIHCARGQCFLPSDILDAHQVDREAVFTGRSSPGLIAAHGELRSVIRGHVDAVQALVGRLDRAIFPAILPVALVGPQLDKMARRGFDPFSSNTELSPLRRQWILWQAARRQMI